MAVERSQTSAEARVELVKEHVQAEVDHDIERIMATWGESPSFDDEPWHEHFEGRAEIRAHYIELMNAFPDFTLDVEKWHVTDEAVIIEVTFRGTHLGAWRDLPPTGRRTESRVCAIYTVDDQGLLNLERTYYDKAIVLEQLGLFQDPRRPIGRVMAVVTPPFTVVRAFARQLKDRRRARR